MSKINMLTLGVNLGKVSNHGHPKDGIGFLLK
jgi:hypothetical protein